MLNWELHDQDGQVVATVRLPDDPFPEVVLHRGKTYYYDDQFEGFVEADVFIVEDK